MENIESLGDKIKKKTLKNRDEQMKDLEKYDTNIIISWFIDTMKYYSQNDDILTGQYMMVIDAVNKILVKRGVIDKMNTWTLEEFLEDVPYHSEIASYEEDEEK